MAPIFTFIFLSWRKILMNLGKSPFNPISFKNVNTACFHNRSYAFAMSRNTVTSMSDLIKISRIADSNLTRESYVRWNFLTAY